MPQLPKRFCTYCGETFQPRHPTKVLCSPECEVKKNAHNSLRSYYHRKGARLTARAHALTECAKLMHRAWTADDLEREEGLELARDFMRRAQSMLTRVDHWKRRRRV